MLLLVFDSVILLSDPSYEISLIFDEDILDLLKNMLSSFIFGFYLEWEIFYGIDISESFLRLLNNLSFKNT